MRLFTAVYPSESALASLDLALGGISGSHVGDPGLRWVPRDQRHLTLVFHGNVPDGALDDYVAELTAPLAELTPFDVALAGSGTFGGRTLWAGVGTGIEPLRKLSRVTNDAAEATGIRGDNRAGGRPHLTLARASANRREWSGRSRRGRGGRRDDAGPTDGSPPLAHLARALAVYQGPAWTVDEVCVVGSKLGAGPSGGPLHEVIARVPIRG